MRPAIHVNDSRVVVHLRVDEHGVWRLNDLVVAVIGIRQHRWPCRGKRQAPILQPEIVGPVGIALGLGPATPDFCRRRRERRNAAVGGPDDDRGPPCGHHSRAELPEERVVRAGAGGSRAGLSRRLLVAFSDVTLPRGRFGRGEKQLVFQLERPLERRHRGRIPVALKINAGSASTLARSGSGQKPPRRHEENYGREPYRIHGAIIATATKRKSPRRFEHPGDYLMMRPSAFFSSSLALFWTARLAALATSTRTDGDCAEPVIVAGSVTRPCSCV